MHDSIDNAPNAEGGALTGRLAAHDGPLDEDVWLRQRRELLLECMEDLDPSSRELLKLKYYEDLKQTEIASHKRVVDSTIKLRLEKARAALKKCLENKCPDTRFS